MKPKTKMFRSKRSKKIFIGRVRFLIACFCLITLENWGIDGLKGISTLADNKTPQIASYEATNEPAEEYEEVGAREFTAYNAGDPNQTDNSPCIGAYAGVNICHELAVGNHICASNEFPKGTVLEVEGLGRCIVLDKMNARYKNRIDWAMEAHEKPEAVAFGLKKLSVKIVK